MTAKCKCDSQRGTTRLSEAVPVTFTITGFKGSWWNTFGSSQYREGWDGVLGVAGGGNKYSVTHKVMTRSSLGGDLFFFFSFSNFKPSASRRNLAAMGPFVARSVWSREISADARVCGATQPGVKRVLDLNPDIKEAVHGCHRLIDASYQPLVVGPRTSGGHGKMLACGFIQQ